MRRGRGRAQNKTAIFGEAKWGSKEGVNMCKSFKERGLDGGMDRGKCGTNREKTGTKREKKGTTGNGGGGKTVREWGEFGMWNV